MMKIYMGGKNRASIGKNEMNKREERTIKVLEMLRLHKRVDVKTVSLS